MSSIYEICQNLKDMLEFIESDETTNYSDECIRDTFEGLTGSLELKVDSWCKCIKNIKNDVVGLNEEIKRLQEKKTAKEKEIERMKSVLCDVLNELGFDRYKTNIFSLYSFKPSSKLVITDTKLVPDTFKKDVIRREIDKEKVKEELNKKGKLDFAKYISSLTIR